MDNLTIKIDEKTHDILLDESGDFVMIDSADTAAQCVRMALLAFKGEWFFDRNHGTDYNQVLGDGGGDLEQIVREAIFQEPAVKFIDSLTVERVGRQLTATFSARLEDGTAFEAEVTA